MSLAASDSSVPQVSVTGTPRISWEPPAGGFAGLSMLNGLLRACEKRPVPISKLEQIVNEAESFVIESAERERKTSEVGELIMSRLRRYDKVAYVRFASVYLDFKDVQEFMSELKDLLKTKEPEVKPAKAPTK